MTELISVVITTHNRCDLLKKTIDSVLSQTYKNIEVVVVDDASDDDTRNLCSEYGDTLSYIFIPENESKGGNHARNVGIERSKGDYVAFCDDDDIWLPEKLEKQYNLIVSSSVDLVYCGMFIHTITDDGETMETKILDPRNKGMIPQRILYEIPCTTSTILLKRRVLDDVGLFDEHLKYWQEYDLMIRICQIYEIDYVDECLVVYLNNKKDKKRLTNNYFKWLDNLVFFMEKHKELYDKLNIFQIAMVRYMMAIDAELRACNCKKNVYKRCILKRLVYSCLSLPFRFYSKISFLYKTKMV